MKELSPKEEMNLIKYIIDNGDFLDRGSSRAVYTLDNGRVYKIAFDEEGRTQNNLEVDLFECHGKHYLAEIFSYGRYLVEMEQVETPYSSSDLEDYSGGFYYFGTDEEEDEDAMRGYCIPTLEEAEDIERAKEFLDNELGYTSDNFQIGFSRNQQCWVAYDYGYDPNLNRDDQVSEDLTELVDFEGPDYVLEKALEKIKQLLDLTDKKNYNIIR